MYVKGPWGVSWFSIPANTLKALLEGASSGTCKKPDSNLGTMTAKQTLNPDKP